MKTLYNAHGKKKSVEFSCTELVKESERANLPPKHLRGKIIRMYLKIVLNAVLSGHQWKFPNGLRLMIREKRVVGTSGKSRYQYDENKEPKVVVNNRRPNRRYSIDLEGAALDQVKYIFVSNAEFRSKLSYRLFNSDTIYQPKAP